MLKQSGKRKSIVWILVLIIGVVFSATCFLDVIITTRHGINFWSSLFEGKLFEFYSYNLNLKCIPDSETTSFALYNILLYVIFAIWDFPLWVYENITGNNALANPILLVYAKGIVLAFCAACVYVVRQILNTIGIGDNDWNKVKEMMLTSIVMIFTVVSMGQYDVIPLLFILLGVNYYIKGNNKLFSLFFAVAIPLKLFALLFFIPLLLLKEKRVIKAAINTLVVCSIYILTSLVYILCDKNGLDASSSESLLKKMFVNNIELSLEPVSLFLIFWFGIAIWCYLHDNKGEKDYLVPLRICALVSCFGVIIPAHPQWLIYSVPFLCILCGQEKNRQGAFVFLETVFEITVMLSHLIYYTNVCSANIVDITWVGRLCGKINDKDKFLSIFDYMQTFGLGEAVNGLLKACLAVSTISLVMLLYLINTKKKINLSADIQYRSWMLIRALACVAIVAIPYMAYVVYM